ncbi:MAG: DUF4333 domain-containing protein [Myxococcota bacterium]|nr:DUF4333 domain-containing protein [Deltaproteobacteria bacterium]MDQ3338916.1 DUF4333 domain-containing protein [Myxococcota bacterium]
MRRLYPSWILLLAVGCSFEASCGGKKLNIDKAKEFIATLLEKETGAKPTVTCPDSVKIEKDKTFDCTAAFGTNASAKITIKQNDDQGNITVQSATGILIANKLEKQIGEHFGKANNKHVDAACGDRVRPSTAGLEFQCEIKDAAGSTAKVNVKVKDDSGNVDFALAQ